MAVRTTATEVKGILDSCVLADSVVDTYIATANRFINVVYADSASLTDAQLEDIEMWLTAHMISVSRHRQTAAETIDDVTVKYTGYWSKQLESTSYGQMVLMLDTTGLMGNVGKRAAWIKAITSFE